MRLTHATLLFLCLCGCGTEAPALPKADRKVEMPLNSAWLNITHVNGAAYSQGSVKAGDTISYSGAFRFADEAYAQFPLIIYLEESRHGTRHNTASVPLENVDWKPTGEVAYHGEIRAEGSGNLTLCCRYGETELGKTLIRVD